MTRRAFDLETAIGSWRGGLTDRGLEREDVTELESHLLDEVTALQARELSLEEAFLVASRRVGAPAELAREFGKLRPWTTWRVPVYWMATGILLAAAGASALSVATQLGLLAGAGARIGVPGLHLATLALNLGIPVLLLALGGWALTRVPRARRDWAGPALAVLGVVLLPLGLVYAPLWSRVATTINPHVLRRVQNTWMLSSSAFAVLVIVLMAVLVARLRRHVAA